MADRRCGRQFGPRARERALRTQGKDFEGVGAMSAMNCLPAAVFLDAYGTLISWQPQRPPADVVHTGLRRAGLALPFETVERALATEMAFYRDRQASVRTPEQLARLRTESAEVLRDQLGGPQVCRLSSDSLLKLILAAFKTRTLPDVEPALHALRAAGMRTGVLSNFSYLLPLLLDELGLAERLDPVVFSAAIGAEKPDPSIFHTAAKAVGTKPARCVLIGDDLTNDVEGARGVGMPVVWIARDGAAAPPGVAVARSLSDAVRLALAPGWPRLSLPQE